MSSQREHNKCVDSIAVISDGFETTCPALKSRSEYTCTSVSFIFFHFVTTSCINTHTTANWYVAYRLSEFYCFWIQFICIPRLVGCYWYLLFLVVGYAYIPYWVCCKVKSSEVWNSVLTLYGNHWWIGWCYMWSKKTLLVLLLDNSLKQ